MIPPQLRPHQIPQAHFSWPSPGVTKSSGAFIWKSCLHLCYRTPFIPRRQIHLDLFSPQEPSSWLKPPWKRGQRQPGCHTLRKTGTALLGNEQSWLKWLGLVFNLTIFEILSLYKKKKKVTSYKNVWILALVPLIWLYRKMSLNCLFIKLNLTPRPVPLGG